MRTIYNKQTVETIDVSRSVVVSDEAIEILRNWEDFPYSESIDLLEYITEAFERFDNGDLVVDFAPSIMQELYSELHANVTRETIWCSLSKSGQSQICMEDEDGDVIDEVNWTM